MFGRKYPWDFIKEKIKNKFRNEVFPNEDKCARPAEEWAMIERNARTNHPFLYKVEDILLSIEIKIERIIALFDYPRIFYVNAIRDKTHVLPTGLKKGQWHDSSERLFHGVMELLVFFVEHENKYAFENFKDPCEEKEAIGEMEVEEWLNTCSATEEKCISEQERMMIEWLEVYNWYKNVYPTYQKDVEVLYDSLPETPKEWSVMEMFAHKDPERDKIFERVRKLECQEQKEKMEMLLKVVKNYEAMWS